MNLRILSVVALFAVASCDSSSVKSNPDKATDASQEAAEEYMFLSCRGLETDFLQNRSTKTKIFAIPSKGSASKILEYRPKDKMYYEICRAGDQCFTEVTDQLVIENGVFDDKSGNRSTSYFTTNRMTGKVVWGTTNGTSITSFFEGECEKVSKPDQGDAKF